MKKRSSEVIRRDNQRKILKNRELMKQEKNKACADCKKKYPYYVMQFDHLPGSNKSFAITKAKSRPVGHQMLKDEIAKCEVVCANCHASRTHLRKQHLN